MVRTTVNLRALDNTIWRAGQAGGPCFQMKNVNCQQAAQKTDGRAAEKGSPLACPVVQSAGLPFCAARQPRRKCMFFIWQHGPPFSVIHKHLQSSHRHVIMTANVDKGNIDKSYPIFSFKFVV